MGIDITNIKTAKKETKKANNRAFDFFEKDISFKKKLTAKHKEVLYKDLSVLLGAGIDFKTSLDILISQQKQKFIVQLLEDVRSKVIRGKRFNEALEESGAFTPYEFFSIKIGEETKKLETVLLELHKFFSRQVKLRKQIISVITYPAFVLVLTFGVLYFMLAYVVPMFKSVFTQFGSDLPALTQKIIYFSERLPQIVFALVFFSLIAFILYKIFEKTDGLRSVKYKIVNKIPFFGRLTRAVYLARFCQFLDLLLSSKTPLTDSLDMVKLMIGYYPIENSIDKVKQDVIRGANFADAMKSFPVYESKLISMVEVAEKINQLDTMFSRLAVEYEEEVEHKTKMLGVVLEPLIIIIIGGVVGVIMVAMYAPMFDLSKLINQ